MKRTLHTVRWAARQMREGRSVTRQRFVTLAERRGVSIPYLFITDDILIDGCSAGQEVLCGGCGQSVYISRLSLLDNFAIDWRLVAEEVRIATERQ